jgi:hypothetical protein
MPAASPLKTKAAASRSSPRPAGAAAQAAQAGAAVPRPARLAPPAKPVPTAPPAWPRGMARFAITLKDDGGDTPPGTHRGRFVRGRLARNERFRLQLLDWLEQQGLAAQVAEVGAPTAFNVLAIVTTAKVAQKLQAVEGVESVFRDLPVRLK